MSDNENRDDYRAWWRRPIGSNEPWRCSSCGQLEPGQHAPAAVMSAEPYSEDDLNLVRRYTNAAVAVELSATRVLATIAQRDLKIAEQQAELRRWRDGARRHVSDLRVMLGDDK